LFACTWKVTNKVLGEGHDEMRKWAKTMHVPESMYHREAFPLQRDKEKWRLKLASKTNPKRDIFLNNPIKNNKA
jgi:hypothetical protein